MPKAHFCEFTDCRRDVAGPTFSPSVYTGVTRLLFRLPLANSISNWLSFAKLNSLLSDFDNEFVGDMRASTEGTVFADSSSKFQYSWSVILIFKVYYSMERHFVFSGSLFPIGAQHSICLSLSRVEYP